MGAKGTGHPFDGASFLHLGPLGIQVIHVFRPVFNRGITELRIPTHKQFYTACVKIGHIIFRCGTSLNKVKVRPFIHDDQCMFKLPRSRRVQPEIGLQRYFHGNSRRHIDKGTT